MGEPTPAIWAGQHGSGEHGDLVRSSGTHYEDGVIQAAAYELVEGATLTSHARQLVILATKSIRIDGTIDMRGKGAAPGEDGLGLAGRPGNANGGGGSGIPSRERQIAWVTGQLPWSEAYGAGGGHGGGEGECGPGTRAHGGGGGGSIWREGQRGHAAREPVKAESQWGQGGAGGGVIILIAPTITLTTTSVLDVRGTDGEPGMGDCASGGGGAGGLVLLRTTTPNVSGQILVDGGAGGSGGAANGGAGARGEVRRETN